MKRLEQIVWNFIKKKKERTPFITLLSENYFTGGPAMYTKIKDLLPIFYLYSKFYERKNKKWVWKSWPNNNKNVLKWKMSIQK